jgi:prolyl-tRNA editing enzyme YbaK/EbsC (Cys-tRNA(Pro) deacylase)
MDYHPVVQKILTLLKNDGCWFETFEHEPVRTSEEAAKVRPEYSLHQGAKALIVRIKTNQNKRNFVMLVFPADFKFSRGKIEALLEAKDIRLATENEVSLITSDIQLGGVPPFGNLFGLEVFVDNSIFENVKIIFNAGDRRFSIAMKSEDYKRLVKPKICEIV